MREGRFRFRIRAKLQPFGVEGRANAIKEGQGSSGAVTNAG